MIWGGEASCEIDNEMHAHQMHELVVGVANGGTQIVDGHSYPIEKGSLFFLPEGSSHAISGTTSKPAHIVYLCFESHHFAKSEQSSFQEMIEKLISERIYHGAKHAELKRENYEIASKIRGELKDRLPWAEAKVELLLGQLLVNLLRSLHLGVGKMDSRKQQLYRLCKKIWKKPIDMEMSLVEAAQSLSMSRSLFTREFKAYSGMSYLDYLQRAKLNLAQKHLGEGDLGITEIALKSGFGNMGHFHRIFKKFFDMTPHQYRKSLKSKGAFLTVMKLH